MLRDQVVREPVPGVLVINGTPDSWEQRLYVATLASNSAGVAGGRSAAALHGMDGYQPGPIELLLPSSRRIAMPGVVMRRGPFEAIDLTTVDGIRCTSIARTLCDLGSIDPPPKVNIAFEWAWRTGVSLIWLQMTATRLVRHRQPGPGIVLALVDRAVQHQRPTESTLEVQVEDALMSLTGMVRQHRVERADGSFVARVDFAIPDLKIAIEAHSRKHHFGHDAEGADADREANLQAEGWIVRFVTDAQRRRPKELHESLARLMTARRLG
jgi:very-short-patch-repair endonuclease